MKIHSWFTIPLLFSLGAPGLTAADAPAGKPKAHAAKPAAAKAAPGKTAAATPAKPAAPILGLLPAGPAEITPEHVNVRAKADVDSDVVARLKQKDTVQVIEEITIAKPGPGEPSRWAKIAWPAGTPVWVYADFLDTAASTVKVPKLNLRSGPGENHSVVGILEKGKSVKKLEAKGDWWKVEAPDSIFAFVASSLLHSKGPAEPAHSTPEGAKPPAEAAPVVATAPVPRPANVVIPPRRPFPLVPPANPVPMPPATEVAVVPPPAPVVPAAPVPRPLPPSAPVVVSPAPVVPPPAPVVVPPAPAPVAKAPLLASREPGDIDLRPIREDSFIKRVVSREGRVRRSYNIQSPTSMVLENVQNGRIMNYLYSTSTNLDMASYRGRVVTVTGEEALDERWPNIPVIRVETLQTAP